MVTIHDVAREAGVSVATVSRALNNHVSVNPAMATRAREAADRLGYRPNGIARSLRRQSTDVLALIISDVANPFYTAITRGVEDVAQRGGYSVLLCNADERPDKESTYLRVVEQEQVAGVLISPHSAATDVSRLRAAAIPVVVIDRPLEGDFDSVMVESVEGARRATAHLLDEGWQRPGCVTGPADAATAQQRAEGYRQALAAVKGFGEQESVEQGSPEPLIARGEFRQAGGRQAAAALLDLPAPPDSFFVANAPMALGVLEELRARGLRVGSDVGMVVFDDAPWAPFIEPPMTVIAQPAYEIGAHAASLLLERIQGSAPTAGRHSRLSTQLIVRGSSIRR